MNFVFENVTNYEDRRTLAGIAAILNCETVLYDSRNGIIEIKVKTRKLKKFIGYLATLFSEDDFTKQVYRLDQKMHVTIANQGVEA